MAAGFASLMSALLLLLGGGSSLVDFIDPEPWLAERDVAYEASALRSLLSVNSADAGRDADELIARLGAETHAEREDATRRLRQRGPDVKPALEAALRNPDPEIAQRARRILDALPEAPEDPRLLRLMAIIGLGRLGDGESVTVLASLAKGDGVEAEVARTALEEIRGEEASTAPEADPSDFARFPASTVALAAWRPGEQNREMMDWIRSSPPMQDMLIKVLSELGDLGVDGADIALDGGFLMPNRGDVSLLVDLRLRHDPLRLARWLLREGKFQARETDARQAYLVRDHLLVMPVDGTRLLVAFHSGREPESMLSGLVGLLSPDADMSPSATLLAGFNRLPAGSELRAAFAIPPGNALPENDLAALRSGRMHAGFDEETKGLRLAAWLTADTDEDAEALRNLVEKTRGELAANLGRNANDQTAGMLKAVESTELEREDATLRFTAGLPMSVLTGILGRHQAVQVHMRQHDIQRRIEIENQIRMRHMNHHLIIH